MLFPPNQQETSAIGGEVSGQPHYSRCSEEELFSQKAKQCYYYFDLPDAK